MIQLKKKITNKKANDKNKKKIKRIMNHTQIYLINGGTLKF